MNFWVANNAIYIIIGFMILIISCATWTLSRNIECHQLNTNTIKINEIVSNKVKQYTDIYAKNEIVYIEDIFETVFFNSFVTEIEKFSNDCSLKSKTNELFHLIRKASTITATKLRPVRNVNDLYNSVHLMKFIQEISGNKDLKNVDCTDEASMNLLIYDSPNDFISWHTDPNHYVGQRLTVLISLVNRGSNYNGLSKSELQYITSDLKQHSIQMKPNSMLIFNGSVISHQATPINKDEIRIVLSFTYCNICEETIFGNFLKQCKQIVLGYYT